jgi:uncharacterized membrane protein
MEPNKTNPKRALRPGIVLVWLGLVLSILAIGCLLNDVGKSDASHFVLGVFSIFIGLFFYVVGMGLACLAVIFAVWGFVVTLVHRTGAHILASVSLALSLLAGTMAMRTWM